MFDPSPIQVETSQWDSLTPAQKRAALGMPEPTYINRLATVVASIEEAVEQVSESDEHGLMMLLLDAKGMYAKAIAAELLREIGKHAA